MSRETAYARMLDASAKLQWNVAMILEAKALEAEKVRSWLINQSTREAYAEQQEHLRETLQVHEQLIEVIDGLTKLNQGMVSVLRANYAATIRTKRAIHSGTCSEGISKPGIK